MYSSIRDFEEPWETELELVKHVCVLCGHTDEAEFLDSWLNKLEGKSSFQMDHLYLASFMFQPNYSLYTRHSAKKIGLLIWAWIKK